MGQDSSHPPPTQGHRDEVTGLTTSRADFAASLSRRLESLLGAITSLEQQLDAQGRRDNLLRRIHALSASAKVLGFAAVADVLSRAEHRIRTSHVHTLSDDLSLVRTQLATLPALAQRAIQSIAPTPLPLSSQGPKSASEAVTLSEPFCVLLFGKPSIRDSLLNSSTAHSNLEIVVAAEPNELRRLVTVIGPDAILLDATYGSVTLLVDELTQSPETASVPIVALNVPEDAAVGLVDLGVRTALSSRATDQQILRALHQAVKPVEHRPHSIPPYGELSLVELADRIAEEVRLAIVDSAGPSARAMRVGLGDGKEVRAALWSALSQIREHVVERSSGRVHFDNAPDGSVPLAPGAEQSNRRSAQSRDPVDLTGRRILVADDDPAVAWLVAGLLRAAGAVVTEAHDGARALDLSYRLWPELVISDILMPELDGFALCHALKRDALLRDVPVVLLSWKEDLLFRLRDLGSDADGYLRKEAAASSIVSRAQELLAPRRALERRLTNGLSSGSPANQEVRGRLDNTTVRLLLELATTLDRPVRIALRDAHSLFDLRVAEGTLKAATRTRNDGTAEHGAAVLPALIGVHAGRFSITRDSDPYRPDFEEALPDLLRPVALRARAAQRVLSGLTLGLVDGLSLDPDVFAQEFGLLPLSLRPIAEELMRGTAPRNLLASGAASVHLLETLLADIARRGAVRAITNQLGEDLLEQEIEHLRATPAVVPPKPTQPPTPLFTFQLSPSPPQIEASGSPPQVASPQAPTAVERVKVDQTPPPNPDTWALPSGTLAGVGHQETEASKSRALPLSRAPQADDIDWAMELSWDETPPPALAPVPPPLSEPPPSRVAVSSTFMRPSLPTVDRSQIQDAPALADAVARAFSLTEPSQDDESARAHDAATQAPTDEQSERGDNSATAISTEPDLAAPSNLSLSHAEVTAPNPNPNLEVVATQKPEGSEGEEKTQTSVVAPDSETIRPPPKDLEAEGLDRLPTQWRAQQPSQSETPLIALADLHRLAIESTRETDENSATAQMHFAPSASTPEAPEPPAPTSPQAVTTEDAPAPKAATEQAQPAAAKPTGPYDSDPVFPLISAAPPAVDVQPAIVVGESASESTLKTAQPEPTLAPSLPPLRDTLRSPGDTGPAPKNEPSEHPAAGPSAPEPDQAGKTEQESRVQKTEEPKMGAPAVQPARVEANPQPVAPSPQLAGLPHAPAKASSTPPPSEARSESAARSLPMNSFSWPQAIGLAFLAGIVTFALTVPIASWFHNRRIQQRPQPTAVPSTAVSAPALPAAQEPSLPLATSTPETDASDASTNAAPLSSGEPPKPLVEEIPTPSDVALAPNQALIEVLTSGSHAIFVDDSFVGRGPVRVITVSPGRHLVRTRLNGVERTDTIEVGAGRSMRLSLEQAWK